ncbi:MAG: DUF2723 domain-containing protein [Deltaproteobacteria bacterium]|jgi:tetratricopeptide (TPR) repeat protein|nr:DUF2723 domain-containing protein [Deltaproteobacteria bacterium]
MALAPKNQFRLATLKEPNYLLFLFSLAVSMFYVICATPAVGWRDGPELVVTATYLDIAHPAGFPTYNLLTKIITWLPLGSLGFRLSMFSALAGGATIFVLGLWLKKIHLLDSHTPPSLPWLWAALPFLALARPFWAASVEVEVYSLNLFFIVALLYCATCWFVGQSIGWLMAGGFLYGISCGNHAALALYLPVLILLTVWGGPSFSKLGLRNKSNYTIWMRILILAGLFLVGVSVYLLLIVRSNLDYLPINFGQPNNWESFFYHVSDAKDRNVHASGILAFGKLFFYLGFHFRNLTSWLFWPATPFVLAGLIYLWRRYQILSVALITLIMINMGFFFYWIDGVSAFLPSFLAWFIFLSLGLGQFGRWLGRFFSARRSITAAGALILVGLISLGPSRFYEREIKAGFMATELFWSDFASLPPETVLLHSSNWFSAVALQTIYSVRPDVSLINWPWLDDTRNSPTFSKQKFPMIALPLAADGQPLSHSTPGYSSLFLKANLDANKPIYIQFSNEAFFLSPYIKPELNFRWLGQILPNELTSQDAYQTGDFEAYLNQTATYFDDLALGNDPPLAQKAPAYLFYIVRPVLEFVNGQGNYQLAEKIIRRFFERFTDPSTGRLMLPYDAALNAQAFISELLFRQHRFDEATLELKKLIELDPSNAYSYLLLGISLASQGDHQSALDALLTASKKDPNNPQITIKYANYLAKYHSIQIAVDFLNEKINYFKRHGLTNAALTTELFQVCLLVPPEEPSQFPAPALSETNQVF